MQTYNFNENIYQDLIVTGPTYWTTNFARGYFQVNPQGIWTLVGSIYGVYSASTSNLTISLPNIIFASEINQVVNCSLLPSTTIRTNTAAALANTSDIRIRPAAVTNGNFSIQLNVFLREKPAFL